jgi:hypothetical protein
VLLGWRGLVLPASWEAVGDDVRVVAGRRKRRSRGSRRRAPGLEARRLQMGGDQWRSSPNRKGGGRSLCSAVKMDVGGGSYREQQGNRYNKTNPASMVGGVAGAKEGRKRKAG